MIEYIEYIEYIYIFEGKFDVLFWYVGILIIIKKQNMGCFFNSIYFTEGELKMYLH